MTPGTLILLGDDLPDSLAGDLRGRGHHVIAPRPSDPPSGNHRYVAGCALEIAAGAPASPLVLVAGGDAGPLVPSLALAQRAAKRTIGAYVFLDADLPAPADTWPDAPCAYLSADPGDPRAHQASLRAWTVFHASPGTLAEALRSLITAL
ncbi:hypothetical protein [Actinocorallia longicatena]|uniref:Nucleoside 2-deoxyribosyltransferase n=1 Tax=Actinocorallia longicatena TaxID=111803 RepID=A0ABP6QRI5_9ACTN